MGGREDVVSITRAEALKKISELHEAWGLKHGSDEPYVDNPAPGTEPPANAQDELNVKIAAILAQIE
jgi:hypothetical protein